MSVTAINNFVIVFPDPALLAPGSSTFTLEIVPKSLSFDQRLTTNLQTLSTNNADPDGVIQGLLYVPDLNPNDPCSNSSLDIIPHNVTRQRNLPNANFNIIALAPWINANCTRSYLASAHFDPLRAFIFYLPDNETSQPPPISSSVWDMNDGGGWKAANPFPVYAVPGSIGSQMMRQLSWYSGNMTDVPFGHKLNSEYQLDPRSYVRVYTEIDITSASSLPSLWVFLLIVIGGLIFILSSISLLMRYIQRRRRESLRRRIASGHVDLEALGIKRLTVPKAVIDKMPLYIYTCDKGETLPESGTKTNVNSGPVSPHGIRTSFPTSAADSTHGSGPTMTNAIKGSGILEDSESPSSLVITTQKYSEQSQPTCPICLDDFDSGSTLIRELPCGHIFHPECIDSFLRNNSSLCPMCKKTTLPLGYCPETITNSMVRRERAIRRLRSRVTVNDEGHDVEVGWMSRANQWRSLCHRIFIRTSNPDTVSGTVAAYNANLELGALQSINASRSREQHHGLSRQEIAQLRAPELVGDSGIAEHADDARERRQSKWRKAMSRVFPGFK